MSKVVSVTLTMNRNSSITLFFSRRPDVADIEDELRRRYSFASDEHRRAFFGILLDKALKTDRLPIANFPPYPFGLAADTNPTTIEMVEDELISLP